MPCLGLTAPVRTMLHSNSRSSHRRVMALAGARRPRSGRRREGAAARADAVLDADEVVLLLGDDSGPHDAEPRDGGLRLAGGECMRLAAAHEEERDEGRAAAQALPAVQRDGGRRGGVDAEDGGGGGRRLSSGFLPHTIS